MTKKIHKCDHDRLIRLYISMGYSTELAKRMATDRLSQEMIVKKITTGFVIQTFDTEKKEFIHQEFIAGDIVEFEDEQGKTVEPFLEYLPFDMVQPKV